MSTDGGVAMTSEENLAAAREIVESETIPRIEDAFHHAFVSVRPNAWLSALAVACLYLAEHPADDDAPVTEEWLRITGFRTNAARGYPASHAFELGRLSMTFTNDHWYFGAEPIPNQPTRGHVRRLCAALGIPLNAAS